ncbi:MAG: tetratricopeptide repeat protein [Sphingobacteriales bacterium]|nr:tetratricopeptide repeat protein [Sphingobacteriales bacterium]
MPYDTAAIGALESIYTATHRWDDLAEVYRRRLEVEPAGEGRLPTLRQLARLQEEQLGDLDAAVSTYRDILAIAAQDAAALESLARIHRNRGQWSSLAEVLQQQLAHEGGRAGAADVRAGRDPAPPDRPIRGRDRRLPGGARSSSPSTAARSQRSSSCAPPTRPARWRCMRAAAVLPPRRGSTARGRGDGDHRRGRDRSRGPSRPVEQLAGIYEKMPERRVDALRIRGELFRIDPREWNTRQVLARLGNDLGRPQDVAAAYADVLAALAAEAEAAESEGRTPHASARRCAATCCSSTPRCCATSCSARPTPSCASCTAAAPTSRSTPANRRICCRASSTSRAIGWPILHAPSRPPRSCSI